MTSHIASSIVPRRWRARVFREISGDSTHDVELSSLPDQPATAQAGPALVRGVEQVGSSRLSFCGKSRIESSYAMNVRRRLNGWVSG